MPHQRNSPGSRAERRRPAPSRPAHGGARAEEPEAVRDSHAARSLTGRKLTAALCLLLAAATIALYVPVLGHGFVVWDDAEYVTANVHVNAGLKWSTVRWALRSTEASNWHPLTWLSHALDCQFFGLHAAGHHLDSVLLHALNAVFLFLLLRGATARVWPSLLVAALFSVHPLNMESVAWIAERKNLLSTAFFFLAIGAYSRYARRPGWRRYLLVAALFALGLMAKPMVITLPFVLLLLDYWPLGRFQSPVPPAAGQSPVANQQPFWKLALEKAPLLLLSAGSAWITTKAQRESIGTFAEFPPAVRVGNAVVSYALYLWKMIWPARLAAFYPHPAEPQPLWQVTLSALVLGAITVFVVLRWWSGDRRRRYLPVGWFWYLGTLVPVIGLVQVGGAAMADRYAYIPLIGVFIMIAWSLNDWAETHGARRAWRVLPALCVLGALAWVTLREEKFWESEYSMWARAVAVTERNPLAHAGLAKALMEPDSSMSVQDLREFNTEEKRMDAARAHYEEAVVLFRQQVRADAASIPEQYERTLINFRDLDQRQNRLDDARRHMEEALALFRRRAQQDPDKFLSDVGITLQDLGTLAYRQKQMDDARRYYEGAVKTLTGIALKEKGAQAPLALTLNDLGAVDQSQNRYAEATRHFRQALEIYRQLAQSDPQRWLPSAAMVLTNMAILDGDQHRMDEARAELEEALADYRTLAQGDRRYADKAENVALSLKEMGN